MKINDFKRKLSIVKDDFTDEEIEKMANLNFDSKKEANNCFYFLRYIIFVS